MSMKKNDGYKRERIGGASEDNKILELNRKYEKKAEYKKTINDGYSRVIGRWYSHSGQAWKLVSKEDENNYQLDNQHGITMLANPYHKLFQNPL